MLPNRAHRTGWKFETYRTGRPGMGCAELILTEIRGLCGRENVLKVKVIFWIVEQYNSGGKITWQGNI